MRTLVGYVGVDAGLMWVGDPCYVIGETDKDRETEPTWHKEWNGSDDSFCGLLDKMDTVREGTEDEGRARVYPFPYALKTAAEITAERLNDNHGCTGIAVSSGYGDGCYPVYVEYKDGRVASVTVEFMEEPDEDDDYDRCDDCGEKNWNCCCRDETEDDDE